MTLAQRVGILTRAEERATELRGVRNATLISRLRALEIGLTSREMANLHHHMLRIKEAIDRADTDTRKARERVEKAREKLVERRRDERAIELHRQRRWQAWRMDYDREESRILDDLATIRHVRRESE